MGRLGSAKVWKNNIPEFIRRYNSLIDLLDRETRYEGKIGDKNVVIVINPVDGFRITVNGIETFYLDPLSGSIAVTQYDAEFLKVVYKDTFTEHSILKVDAVPSGSDPVPSPLTVAEGTLVGRIPGGAIAALTIEQVVNLLALQAGDVSIHDEDNLFTSSTVEGALAEAMTNVNGIIAATVPYNNSSSSLTSTTVQDAIDELSDRGGFQSESFSNIDGGTPNSVYTITQNIDGGIPNSVYIITQNIDGGIPNSVYTITQNIDGGTV